MPMFTKLLCFMLVPVILLSLLAMPSLNGEDEPTEGADAAPSADSWRVFRAEGASFVTPAGFQLTDPFTTGTPHHEQYWSMSWPAKSTSVAHVAAPAGNFQVFLHRGDARSLGAIAGEALGYYDGNVMVELEPVRVWKTADGTPVEWRLVRYRPGLVASKDSTYLLGHGARGDRGFLVNAGGHTAAFDLDVVRALVESVRLGD